jgi:SsrA-binding protein
LLAKNVTGYYFSIKFDVLIGLVDMSEKKIISVNKKASFSYDVEAKYEAGIVLKGTEVKALREGRANLKESFAKVKNNEVFLYDCHISPYSHGNQLNHDPIRPKKLLLHKREIKKLIGKVAERGYTLVPLTLYFLNGKAKLELGLAKGKRLHDKRQTMKEREAKREVERAFKQNQRR